MTLIRTSNEALPTFFDDFFGRDWFMNSKSNFANAMPAVNIADNQDDYEVEVAAPGLSKKDFKVELENQLLMISYEKEETSNESESNYTKREFYYNSFRRSFTLPETVESDKIQAKYTDGILKIMIPKKEVAKQKPSRLISIK